MTEYDDNNRRLCGAKTRKGTPCRAPAMNGTKRCRMHGASAPQVRAKAAREILRELIGPALDKLRDLVDDPKTPPAVRLAAVKDILDRTGHAAPRQIEVLSIDVIDREIARLEAELADEAS